jgi:hypothetical protein
MMSVRKIAHASYEIPDLDQQVDYYTDVLGVTLSAREKDIAYLSTTIDHHSIVLHRARKPNAPASAFSSVPMTTSMRSKSRPMPQA